MKLLWATPANHRSAIGRAGLRVAEQLARRGHEVSVLDLQQHPGAPTELHATFLEIRHWTEVAPHEIRASYDLVIAEIGDYFTFHAGLFQLLDYQDCVGVFHDFFVYNLFSGWLFHHGLGPEVHDQVIAATYGAQSREDAERARRGQLDLSELADRLPMTEWIARRCVAVLAHSRFYLPRLAAGCPGPAAQTPLAWTPRPVPPPARRARERLVVLTLGVMNPNKCVEQVITAIAGAEALRSGLEYRLVGPIDPAERDRLEDLARAAGFEHLTICGAVSDEELERHLAAADIISCLRAPVLEGASASVIEGLLSGRPVIVADAGCYAEIPDDLVFKVSAAAPPHEIAAHLARLAQAPGLRGQVGHAAASWAAQTHAPAAYAERLEQLLQDAAAQLPTTRLAVSLAADLAGLGLDRRSEAIPRIAAQLAPLLPG